jgi:hypothetical protein
MYVSVIEKNPLLFDLGMLSWNHWRNIVLGHHSWQETSPRVGFGQK